MFEHVVHNWWSCLGGLGTLGSGVMLAGECDKRQAWRVYNLASLPGLCASSVWVKM